MAVVELTSAWTLPRLPGGDTISTLRGRREWSAPLHPNPVSIWTLIGLLSREVHALPLDCWVPAVELYAE